MVIEQSIVELDVEGSARDYIFRVKGWNEYLDADIPLADYQFIQHNIKLDRDVHLVLGTRSALRKDSWARTVSSFSSYARTIQFMRDSLIKLYILL